MKAGELGVKPSTNFRLEADSCCTTIDARHLSRVFVVGDDAILTLININLVNGEPQTNASSVDDGGCIKLAKRASLSMTVRQLQLHTPPLYVSMIG